jgi:pyrroloquinoline quinone (PQQ) biosynthesis protein C
MEVVSLRENLERHALRSRLVQHPLFDYIENGDVSRDLVARFVGQWWHPLHYFPTFLARTIAAANSLQVQTAASRILFQELGEGDSSRAHESIYSTTMQSAGFSLEQIQGAAPLPTTTTLVNGYRDASKEEISGIGFMYATEVVDLAIVSEMGKAVRRVVGPMKLQWVDIHVQQEPDHVQEARSAVSFDFSAAETAEIIVAAEMGWKQWIGFFDSLHALADQSQAA